MTAQRPAWLDDGTWLALAGAGALTLVDQFRGAGLGPQERPPALFWVVAAAGLGAALYMNRRQAPAAAGPPPQQLAAKPQAAIGALSPVALAYFRKASKDKLVLDGAMNGNTNSISLRLRSNAALRHWLEKAKKAALAAGKEVRWQIQGRRKLTVTFSR